MLWYTPMLGSKSHTYGRYIRFLSMLGIYVALYWILIHLPKAGIYWRRFAIYTVDQSVYMQAFAA